MNDGPDPKATARRDLLERSLVTIRDLRARLEAAESHSFEPVAIIGVACRFPGGCSTPEQLWRLLRDGGCAIGAVPADRWPDADRAAREGVRGGFLDEDIAGFDAHFFSVSPREAEEMDPQHRLLLETTWEALERAGVDAHTLRGSRTGIFVGISGCEYGLLPRAPGAFSPYTATGLTGNLASGRLAYFYGTAGPAVSIDTACSSSLVAAHLACRSLQDGDCELALVAGVNALLSPQPFDALRQLGALAPDGRCKTFAAEADGYGRGEGCGVMVLKRLSRALADGDPICAVIRGSAVNQDGASSGLTVPNGLAQQALQRQALAAAGFDPGAIDFIETHGTGTPLGDPIEVQAIRAVHAARGNRPLYLGAVKSVLGHLEAAAGIAGLIKVVLALQHRTIPPQRLVGAANPRLNLAAIPAILPDAAVPWETADGRERVAGVSSFGFSGTNAHLIVSEAPRSLPRPAGSVGADGDPPLLLKITADSDAAVRELARRFGDVLGRAECPELRAFCLTANRRASLPKRAVVIVRDRPQLRVALGALATGAEHPDVVCAGEFATGGGRDATPGHAWARRFVAGEAIAWAAEPRPGSDAWVPLPTYPFQHRRYWLPTAMPADTAVCPRQVDSPADEQAVEFALGRANLPDAADNNGVLHVGHYQALVAASVREVERPRPAGASPASGWSFDGAEFLFALRLPDTGSIRVQVLLGRPEAGRQRYRVFSRAVSGRGWVLHARGFVRRAATDLMPDLPSRAAATRWTDDDFYARLREQGFVLGPRVSLLREIAFGDDHATGRITAADQPPWSVLPVAPAVFDVCGQLLFAAAGARIGPRTTFMVARWDRLTVHEPAGAGDLRVRLAVRPDEATAADPGAGGMPAMSATAPRVVADYCLEREDGTILAVAEGIEFQLLSPERIRMLQDATDTPPSQVATAPMSEADARAALVRIVSAAVRIPPSELDPAESLRRLGVDSIVGVEIRGRVQRELGASIPLERFILGATLDELARELRAAVAAPTGVPARRLQRARPANPWLVCEAPRPDARLRLFCVPSGSLGASQFAGWAERLPADIEVHAWQLPGREERFAETPFEDLEPLVSAMVGALSDEIDRPYAIYGHSLGALIAFRLAYRLWQHAAIKPVRLLPGAFTSPTLPNPVVAKYRRRFQTAGLPDIPTPRDRAGHGIAAQFVREGLAGTTALNTEELAGAMLPTMLADLALVRQYRHDPAEPRFDVPITAFHGDRDVDVTRAEIERWRDLTTGKFDCHVLSGDHFFMHKNQARDSLIAAICTSLYPTLAAADHGGSSRTFHPHYS